MIFVGQLFLIIFLCGTSCAWELMMDKNSENRNEASSKIYNVLIEIFKLYEKDYATVFISSDIKELNLRWLQELQDKVTIFSHDYKARYHGNLQRFQKFDASVFIIEKMKNIDHILYDIMNCTTWMRVPIPLYVLYVKPCTMKDVKNIIEIIDMSRPRESYLLCSTTDQKRKIYTYNYNSNYAPHEWKPIRGITWMNNISLFERTYKEGTVDSSRAFHRLGDSYYVDNEIYNDIFSGHVGNNFDFDRKKHLDDYKLIIAIQPSSHYGIQGIYDQKILKNHPKYVRISDRLIIDTLKTAFKLKIMIYFPRSNLIDKQYASSLDTYLLNIWFDSNCDVLLIMKEMDFEYNQLPWDGSYPVSYSEYAIATYHRGYKTPAEKIRDFYGIWISLFTLFVLTSTFIVIWFTERRNIAFTMFEIIRLLISQSLYTRMNTFSLRIFFSMVFIYFLIIQATFNGHLAEFLTKPHLRQHPDTLEDLRDLGFTKVYYRNDVQKNLSGSLNKWNNLFSVVHTCLQYLIHNDTSVACIESYDDLPYLTYNQNNVYFSKKTFGLSYYQYSLHRHSPLYSRLYQFFIWFEELGFSLYSRRNLSSIYYYKTAVYETNLNQLFRSINLKDLIFAFFILGIGLCAATLTFFIEKLLNLRNIRNDEY